MNLKRQLSGKALIAYVKPYGLGLNFGVYYHLNVGK
jgi:hypothetical protein